MFVPPAIVLGPVRLDFATPVLMGVLNVTPDSFSDGGAFASLEAAVGRTRELVTAGARIVDVGGESTRPGAAPVNADIEEARVVPVIRALAEAQLAAAISIDTAKAQVAKAALRAGAHLVNDVSALRDPAMGEVVAAARAALILMHMRGEPRTMQKGDIVYDDVVTDIRSWLGQAVERAVQAGIERSRLMVDPGLGFGKTAQHNLEITARLGEFASLGCPIVYGPSRKRFLGEVTGKAVDDRDRATAAACALAVVAGAHVLRVHDVAAVIDAVAVARAVRDAQVNRTSNTP